MESFFDNVENKLDGYKYLLGLDICIEDPLTAFSSDRLCICDTRDDCIIEMKKCIEAYIEVNKGYGSDITGDDYNITRLGTIVKWVENRGQKDEKSWWWSFGIFPIRYIKENENE